MTKISNMLWQLCCTSIIFCNTLHAMQQHIETINELIELRNKEIRATIIATRLISSTNKPDKQTLKLKNTYLSREFPKQFGAVHEKYKKHQESEEQAKLSIRNYITRRYFSMMGHYFEMISLVFSTNYIKGFIPLCSPDIIEITTGPILTILKKYKKRKEAITKAFDAVHSTERLYFILTHHLSPPFCKDNTDSVSLHVSSRSSSLKETSSSSRSKPIGLTRA